MSDHKHASVLRAIADGASIREFEVSSMYTNDTWRCATEWSGWIFNPGDWKVRRKMQYIIVNGFKVPKPLDSQTAPNTLASVFWPYVTYDSLWNCAMPTNGEAKLAIIRGVAHTTKQAAITHAKAMLGIDPES